MIVGVRFKSYGRVHYYDDSGISLSFADRVLVESDDGEREASVVIGSDQTVHTSLTCTLPRVLSVVERAPEIP
ncbi:MAG: hypothetical protein OXC95_08315 [Dehalococcoidia bacterium]|nr:hypothetical protein [Dehalococcoidia bacterium]